MPTKTDVRGAKSDREGLFNWGDQSTGVLVGAAAAGAALGIAANFGRKALMQMPSVTAGSWDQALAAEHKIVLALFDKLEATDDSQTMMRQHILAKIKAALAKHAIEEEMVIYPALRQANETDDADHLNDDHGYVKTYLYELATMSAGDASWLARARDFRALLEKHMEEEEGQIFPRLKAKLSDDQNASLTTMMNKEGFANA